MAFLLTVVDGALEVGGGDEFEAVGRSVWEIRFVTQLKHSFFVFSRETTLKLLKIRSRT